MASKINWGFPEENTMDALRHERDQARQRAQQAEARAKRLEQHDACRMVEDSLHERLDRSRAERNEARSTARTLLECQQNQAATIRGLKAQLADEQAAHLTTLTLMTEALDNAQADLTECRNEDCA